MWGDCSLYHCVMQVVQPWGVKSSSLGEFLCGVSVACTTVECKLSSLWECTVEMMGACISVYFKSSSLGECTVEMMELVSLYDASCSALGSLLWG